MGSRGYYEKVLSIAYYFNYNGAMGKLEDLKKLEEELGADRGLPFFGQANLVFGEGRVDAEVMFVGEGPGFHEDRLGRPFVGRAGQLLRQMIRDLNWKEEDVYITNIIKRRPPENRDPLPDEIEAYKPYLTKQIEIIGPKVVVALGRFSMNYFLPEAKISRDQGKVFRIQGRLVVPLFHPAAALRSTEVLKQLRESFRKLPAILEGKNLVEIKPEVRATPSRPPQAKLF